MTEVEKQEGQKTVVAFVTGLLIGGLLVWVFSSTPEGKNKPEEKSVKTDSEQVEQGDTKTEEKKSETAEVKENIVVGKGAISVADQSAGTVVTLGKVEFPSRNGWVVVRDYADGKSGNVLGASRYSADDGLVPTTVDLMRATKAGNSYQVVFFTNGGDTGFSLADDVLIEGTETTFKAN